MGRTMMDHIKELLGVFFRKPLVNAELLEFVIKRQSANHSWWPSSKVAPKKSHNGPQYCRKIYHAGTQHTTFSFISKLMLGGERGSRSLQCAEE